MQNIKRKIANAHSKYAQAQEQTQQCKAELATGGSYVLYKMAIAEEDAARQRLQELYALAGYADVVVD